MTLSRSQAGKLGYAKTQAAMERSAAQRHADSLAKYKAQNKKCYECGARITYEKRRNDYCNQSCAAKYNNPKRAKKTACVTCGELLPQSTRVTCSYSCLHIYRKVTYIERWLRGEESGGTWWGVSKYVREWLIDTYGEKCCKCGWAEVHTVTGSIPVQVDHIDGDPYNHRPENIRLLCPNCHSLTSTYGGLNRGNGRKERYSEKV